MYWARQYSFSSASSSALSVPLIRQTATPNNSPSTVSRISGTLSADELAELKEYCQCQYNDCWGEDFAKRPRRTEHGDLCVSFYVDSSDSILTKEELSAEKLPDRAPRQPMRGGEAR